MAEDRVVLCKEPSSHFPGQSVFRGLPYLLFNGTMASPPRHPFWLHLLSYLPALLDAKEVIDATGPVRSDFGAAQLPGQGALVDPSVQPCSRRSIATAGGPGGGERKRREDPVCPSLGRDLVDDRAER